MTSRKIAVLFRKQANDGNFGSETAEIYTEEWLTEDVSDEEERRITGQMLAYARSMVHAELRQSPSGRVRQAIAKPFAAVPGEDDDGAE